MKQKKKMAALAALALVVLLVIAGFVGRTFRKDDILPVQCTFDMDTGDLCINLEEAYRFDRIDLEYGYLPEPQFSSTTHKICLNAYDIPFHKSECISLWISPTESSTKMCTHVVYEVLWQSENELDIMRCKEMAGEIFNSDRYDLTTRKIVSK